MGASSMTIIYSELMKAGTSQRVPIVVLIESTVTLTHRVCALNVGFLKVRETKYCARQLPLLQVSLYKDSSLPKKN